LIKIINLLPQIQLILKLFFSAIQ